MKAQNIKFEIGATISWKVEVFENCFVGKCDALRLVTQADTLNELKQSMADMLKDLFEDLILSDELEQYLREVGWTNTASLPSISREDIEKGASLYVPFEIIL